jgi:hypothetical protein
MISYKTVVSASLMLGLFIFSCISTEVFAYSCPKGYRPVINQAGKQSGCRKM